jgi:transcriptional regulator with XRE-family HTH domain
MKERIINIGPRLKQRRKEMRIKQTEMAKELGVSQTYLSNIEGGRTNCSITLFVDICNYLNVMPDYLTLYEKGEILLQLYLKVIQPYSD